MELDRLEQFGENAPGTTGEQAFAMVERELRRVAELHELDATTGDRHPAVVLEAACRAGAITKDTAEAIRGLIVLRDLSAGDPDGTGMSAEKARDYLDLVRAVLYALRATERRDRPVDPWHAPSRKGFPTVAHARPVRLIRTGVRPLESDRLKGSDPATVP